MTDSEVKFDVDAFLKTLTQRPGIYKMLDDNRDILYVGKAKNLKKRVSSYFKKQSASPKHQALLAKIKAIEVLVTHTEGEALLLENQLIKRYQPRFNISLRDDKSYPYVFISSHHDFPQLSFHRGAKKKTGRYFGPYPSAGSVKQTLKLLQKVFPVRQCEDSYFDSRSRPCLQYQIERCTAPCVGLVDKETYQTDVDSTILFLEGNGHLVTDSLVKKMEEAAKQLDFESAARYRDQIQRLRSVLEKYHVHGEKGDVDIIACAVKAEIACIQIFFIRNGQNLGNRHFFPKTAGETDCGNILQAFIGQYYLEKPTPQELIVSHALPENLLMKEVLSAQAKYAVEITHAVRGERLKWLQLAMINAESSLQTKLADRQSLYARFESLQQQLACDEIPQRLECFDISHSQGKETVASCVVFDHEGPVKSAYRRFNIEGISGGDDYAAIHQAIMRRFKRLNKGEHPKPDILLIDGGKGQLNEAKKALTELSINNVMIIAISKGPDRIAGMERIFTADRALPLDISPGCGALLLLQHIRDEAHRFAITGHRQRHRKTKTQSMLETINGLGPKRRQRLLKQFGGLQGVASAGVDALSGIEGISKNMAHRIYDLFHHQDGS
jgi:excinuclease ABC subunit C